MKIVALILSIVALIFVGYSQIDRYNIKKAIGGIKEMKTLTSEQESLRDKIENLEKRINELNEEIGKKIDTLVRILEKALTRYTYTIQSIKVSVDPRDFVDVEEYGGPDLRVFVYLNSKSIIETPVKDDTYTAKWTYPIKTRDYWGQVYEITSKKFDFRLTDNLEIWLLDKDTTKYDRIMYWNPNTPEEAKLLSTPNGTKVEIKLNLIKTKKCFTP